MLLLMRFQNEYSKQIKEYRAQENGKAYGKVFVRVLGVKGIHLPIPTQPTSMTCTLNNGIHFVTTPECQMSEQSRIEQEFELYVFSLPCLVAKAHRYGFA